MIVTPELVRVDLTGTEARDAIAILERAWQMPDGTDVVDRHEFNRCLRHLQHGYYYRLVWPAGTTPEQAIAWWQHAQEILRWRREGKL